MALLPWLSLHGPRKSGKEPWWQALESDSIVRTRRQLLVLFFLFRILVF